MPSEKISNDLKRKSFSSSIVLSILRLRMSTCLCFVSSLLVCGCIYGLLACPDLQCDWLYNTINYKFKYKLLFSTNSLAKLLSDSLLSDSSISQTHSKLYITTLVSITIETVYRLLNGVFFKMANFFPLDNDNVLFCQSFNANVPFLS